MVCAERKLDKSIRFVENYSIEHCCMEDRQTHNCASISQLLATFEPSQ